jgi:hypothetical protein
LGQLRGGAEWGGVAVERLIAFHLNRIYSF